MPARTAARAQPLNTLTHRPLEEAAEAPQLPNPSDLDYVRAQDHISVKLAGT